ncbi:MAG: hypothetical protein JWP88_1756 [Flaviaesturariibacter sp.]|nr:hypothetical protein [Flaviaesturariibacter sp.]
MSNYFVYRFFILAILFILTISTQAQQVEQKTYMQTHTTSDNYLYLTYTRGGKLERSIYYHLYQGQPVFARLEKGMLVGETIDTNQKLLTYIKDNLQLLKYASTRQHNTEKERQKFLADYQDSTIQLMQLSIKTGGLHYNHFQSRSPEQIAATKQQKLRNAYHIINSIVEQMETAATKGIFTKR